MQSQLSNSLSRYERERTVRLILKFVLLTIAIFTLSGCIIPEKFNASFTINADGSADFRYDGTLVYGLAAEHAAAGRLSSKDEKDLEALAGEMRKDKSFRSAKYIGRARYQVVIEQHVLPGKPFYFPGQGQAMIMLLPTNDGQLELRAAAIKEKDLAGLKRIGLNIDGTVSANIAEGLTVVKQNATSTPGLFGLFGAYSWRIKSPSDPTPYMLLKSPELTKAFEDRQKAKAQAAEASKKEFEENMKKIERSQKNIKL